MKGGKVRKKKKRKGKKIYIKEKMK